MTKAELLHRLQPLLAQHSMYRVHADAAEPTARATLGVLAGLPSYEHVFAGDLHHHVVVLALVSGERVTGMEMARRAQLLFERAKVLAERRGAPVAALQLALYERDVPAQERAFVLSKGRKVPLFLRKAQVATWIAALSEPALHAKRLRGWPAELSPEALSAVVAPAAG